MALISLVKTLFEFFLASKLLVKTFFEFFLAAILLAKTFFEFLLATQSPRFPLAVALINTWAGSAPGRTPAASKSSAACPCCSALRPARKEIRTLVTTAHPRRLGSPERAPPADVIDRVARADAETAATIEKTPPRRNHPGAAARCLPTQDVQGPQAQLDADFLGDGGLILAREGRLGHVGLLTTLYLS